jgi:hypothetical protein
VTSGVIRAEQNESRLCINSALIAAIQHPIVNTKAVYATWDVEREILAFVAMFEQYKPLVDLIRGLSEFSDGRLARLLAVAPDLQIQEVKCALQKDSRFRGSGILSVDEQIKGFSYKARVLPRISNALL